MLNGVTTDAAKILEQKIRLLFFTSHILIEKQPQDDY